MHARGSAIASEIAGRRNEGSSKSLALYNFNPFAPIKTVTDDEQKAQMCRAARAAELAPSLVDQRAREAATRLQKTLNLEGASMSQIRTARMARDIKVIEESEWNEALKKEVIELLQRSVVMDSHASSYVRAETYQVRAPSFLSTVPTTPAFDLYTTPRPSTTFPDPIRPRVVRATQREHRALWELYRRSTANPFQPHIKLDKYFVIDGELHDLKDLEPTGQHWSYDSTELNQKPAIDVIRQCVNESAALLRGLKPDELKQALGRELRIGAGSALSERVRRLVGCYQTYFYLGLGRRTSPAPPPPPPPPLPPSPPPPPSLSPPSASSDATPSSIGAKPVWEYTGITVTVRATRPAPSRASILTGDPRSPRSRSKCYALCRTAAILRLRRGPWTRRLHHCTGQARRWRSPARASSPRQSPDRPPCLPPQYFEGLLKSESLDGKRDAIAIVGGKNSTTHAAQF